MGTGIELIAKEREEQLTKHNRTIKNDIIVNHAGQLKEAAINLLTGNKSTPHDWDERALDRIRSKSETEQLVICGALIAAEIDRRQHITKGGIVLFNMIEIEQISRSIEEEYFAEIKYSEDYSNVYATFSHIFGLKELEAIKARLPFVGSITIIPSKAMQTTLSFIHV